MILLVQPAVGATRTFGDQHADVLLLLMTSK
jgi:hypothetical protein